MHCCKNLRRVLSRKFAIPKDFARLRVFTHRQITLKASLDATFRCPAWMALNFKQWRNPSCIWSAKYYKIATTRKPKIFLGNFTSSVWNTSSRVSTLSVNDSLPVTSKAWLTQLKASQYDNAASGSSLVFCQPLTNTVHVRQFEARSTSQIKLQPCFIFINSAKGERAEWIWLTNILFHQLILCRSYVIKW